MTEPFLTIDAVAAHLSVHANTLRSWMKQGMPCYRIGRVVRFKASNGMPKAGFFSTHVPKRLYGTCGKILSQTSTPSHRPEHKTGKKITCPPGP